MNISRLFKNIKYSLYGEEKDIVKLEHNSKEVTNGSLFFCIEGRKTTGNKYINEAIERGAVAVCVSEKDFYECINIIDTTQVSVVVVENVRNIVGLVCNNFCNASRFDFKMIGVTGTNGKTTISFMISNALQKAGYSVGLIGTSGIFINGDMVRGEGLTTPDPIDLYDILSFFYSVDVDFVVMEVSAHALALKKTAGLIFDYGIFTNLTEDHLDFFINMENYGNAKSEFFNQVKTGVFNIDDKFGFELFKKFSFNKISVSKNDADYVYKGITKGCIVKCDNKSIKLNYYLKGEYNACNCAEAYAVLNQIIKDDSIIKKAFKNLEIIDGRYNQFESKYHGKIILDFAHTPDGLEKVLESAKKSVAKNGRLISVFGCGGNRDKDKRQIMGRVSGSIADYTIISIDNPRFEEPSIVMGDIEKGIKEVTDQYNIIMPRENAIRHAFVNSKKGDIIVVSGKGMEPYYEVNGYKHLYREDIIIKTIIKRYDKKEN